jgi:hypothetical protein
MICLVPTSIEHYYRWRMVLYERSKIDYDTQPTFQISRS